MERSNNREPDVQSRLALMAGVRSLFIRIIAAIILLIAVITICTIAIIIVLTGTHFAKSITTASTLRYLSGALTTGGIVTLTLLVKRWRQHRRSIIAAEGTDDAPPERVNHQQEHARDWTTHKDG